MSDIVRDTKARVQLEEWLRMEAEHQRRFSKPPEEILPRLRKLNRHAPGGVKLDDDFVKAIAFDTPAPTRPPVPDNESAAGLAKALDHAGIEVRFNRRNVGIEYRIDGVWRRGERAQAVALERCAEAFDGLYRVRGVGLLRQLLLVVADKREEDGDPHWIWQDMYAWAIVHPMWRGTFSEAVRKAGIANKYEGRGRGGDLVYILGTSALTAAKFVHKNARPDAEDKNPQMLWCGPQSDRTFARGKKRRKKSGVSLKPSTFEAYPDDVLPEWTM